MRYKIDSENSTRINITGRRTGEQPGCVRIFHKGQLSEGAYYKFSGFETFLFTWEKNQEYELKICELEVSLAYSYCPDCVLEQGVRFIEFKDKAYFYTKDNLKDAGEDLNNSGILDSIGSFFSGIGDWFSNLFSSSKDLGILGDTNDSMLGKDSIIDATDKAAENLPSKEEAEGFLTKIVNWFKSLFSSDSSDGGSDNNSNQNNGTTMTNPDSNNDNNNSNLNNSDNNTDSNSDANNNNENLDNNTNDNSDDQNQSNENNSSDNTLNPEVQTDTEHFDTN